MLIDRNDPSTWPHGSHSTYHNLACRCQPCRDDAARYEREYWVREREAFARGEIRFKHGTFRAIKTGCSCMECSDAKATRQRERQARRLQRRSGR